MPSQSAETLSILPGGLACSMGICVLSYRHASYVCVAMRIENISICTLQAPSVRFGQIMRAVAGVSHAWLLRQLCDCLPDMAEQVWRGRPLWTHGPSLAPGHLLLMSHVVNATLLI